MSHPYLYLDAPDSLPDVQDNFFVMHPREPDRDRFRGDKPAGVWLTLDMTFALYPRLAPEKLNVACIGNQVRQMHIHIVGRTSRDPAWPGTVWACPEKQAYATAEVARIKAGAVANLRLSPTSPC